jgi:glutamyl-tRNA synthetase
LDLELLCQHFHLEHISHAPAHYDAAQLNHWQKEAMHQMAEEACWQVIMPYVAEWVPQECAVSFVECVRPNLVMPSDAVLWAKVIFGESLSYTDEALKTIRAANVAFFQRSLELLKEPGMNFSLLVDRLQQETNRKGREIFFPLRAALTNALHGPELAKMLDLMGPEKAQARLAKATYYAQSL